MMRDYRNHVHTPLEKERLDKGLCPVCGKEARSFHFCCSPACTAQYWERDHPTHAQMRRLVHGEQGGRCARCRKKIEEFGKDVSSHPYVLDHVTPIAMGGPQWERRNLQVLCEACNKWKTARDMGRIALYKKSGRVLRGDRTHQARLLPA